MPELSITDLVPLFGLYAETHYRFRYFPFSLYYRREPEIIFDAPHRIEPGMLLPVALIVKDASLFPMETMEVEFEARGGGMHVTQKFHCAEKIAGRLWHRVFDLELDKIEPGAVEITAQLTYKNRQGRIRRATRDNHCGLSKAPLRVWKAADPLPTLPGWHAGELHCHTEFGADQVEFGAPLEVYQRAAEAIGLGWAALTDHSYNLDDLEDDCLRADPNLAKWHRLQDKVESLNAANSRVVLIPGEELSCRSSNGRNVHMVVLGSDKFLHGSGDGAEKWFKTRSEHSVAEALEMLDPHVFIAAAHPSARVGLLERLLVGRGKWTDQDLLLPRLRGWQIMNGAWDGGFYQALAKWRESLLAGECRYIFAGNDAHGNLNLFRQVRLPMIALWEHNRHRFGAATTRVFLGDDRPTVDGLLAALCMGRVFISDGPALEISAVDHSGCHHAGSTIAASRDSMMILRYSSSPEFGAVKRVNVVVAKDGVEFETPWEQHCALQPYMGELAIPLPQGSYLRAELVSEDETGLERRAYTNPIWVVSTT